MLWLHCISVEKVPNMALEYPYNMNLVFDQGISII